jgi:hypothetical protein
MILQDFFNHPSVNEKMQWEIPDIPSKWASIHGKVITVNGFLLPASNV